MNNSPRPQILDRMSVLSDAVRCRILLVVEAQELMVTELCAVLQLPQSTVSRHLKTLVDHGWVASRRNGTRRLYRMPFAELDSSGQELWRLTREEWAGSGIGEQDLRRLATVLARRRSRSREFFATAAGRWDRLRDEMFGRQFYLSATLGLLDADWTVGDLGCGSGPVAEALAPWVGRVIAVDESEAMLETAGTRVAGFDNVELRRGELESLPLEDGTLDAATLVLVLHHVPQPADVLGEVARVLRPGGRLLIVDMLPHDRHEYLQEMGHVWMGFDRAELERHAATSGMAVEPFHALPPDPEAGGPGLFAAIARKPDRI